MVISGHLWAPDFSGSRVATMHSMEKENVSSVAGPILPK